MCLVAVADCCFTADYIPDIKRQTCNAVEGILNTLLFYFKLCLIADVAVCTAAATPEYGAVGLNSVGRRLDYLHCLCNSVILFHLYCVSKNCVTHCGEVGKNSHTVNMAYAASLCGHSRYFKLKFVVLFQGLPLVNNGI